MQYSISAFFLKEVSDMDVYEKLEELQEKALHDDTIRKTLLKTREEKRTDSCLLQAMSGTRI